MSQPPAIEELLVDDEYEEEGEAPTSVLRPLSEDEVAAIISHEIQDALGGTGTQLSEDRSKALSYYNGEPFGNELEGYSTVVLEDVRDTIEWAMPNLMRMLADGEVMVRFEPVGEDDEPGAEQATDYIRHKFWNAMNGFGFCYEQFKTGLLERNAFGKVYVEKRTEPKIDTYEGLDQEQLSAMLAEDGVTLMQQDGPYQVSLGVDPQTGAPMVHELYDVKLRVMRTTKEIKVDGIPPEEALTARRLVDFDDSCPFFGHRKKVTISDLIAMGYPADQVVNLPFDDGPEWEESRLRRHSDDESYPTAMADRTDVASRELWITECFIRIDEDGDGYAELRKIVVVGDDAVKILSDEEINWNPITYFCPILMPHKFYGISLADLVMDLQLIRSTLLRQGLDNTYLANHSRLSVVENMANLDDLLVSRPGGIVRVRNQDAIKPLETRDLGGQFGAMMEFLEGVKETRTGISRFNQGQDASSLNKTATGVTRIMEAAQARLALIAKVYAEIGLKRLFKLLLRSYVEGGFRKETYRLRGQWVSVDPATWNAGMDVTIEVGLSIGQAAERAGQMERVLDMQMRAQERGLGHLVTPDHMFNAVSDFTAAIGIKQRNRYFADPKEAGPPPPPPPNPDMEKIKADAQKSQAELQHRGMELQQKALADDRLSSFRLEELRQTQATERLKIESDQKLKMAELQSRERIEIEKARISAAAAAKKESSDGKSADRA